MEIINKKFEREINILEQASINSGALVGKETEKLCPVNNEFADGMYLREIIMKKHTFVTSRVHKTNHFYFVMKGRVLVKTEDGVIDIKAPFVGMTKAGTKRGLYILEECHWITVHATNETDIDKITKELTCASFDELKALEGK